MKWCGCAMQLRVTRSEFYIWRIQLARLRIRWRSKDGRQSGAALVGNCGMKMVWSRMNGWRRWGWSGSGYLGVRQIRRESWGKRRSWAFLKELWPKGWAELKQIWPVENGSVFHVLDTQQWAFNLHNASTKGDTGNYSNQNCQIHSQLYASEYISVWSATLFKTLGQRRCRDGFNYFPWHGQPQSCLFSKYFVAVEILIPPCPPCKDLLIASPLLCIKNPWDSAHGSPQCLLVGW